MARELTRVVQDLRKKKGLVPRDEIELVIETDKSGEVFIRKFEDSIKKTTNSIAIKFGKNSGQEVKIDELVLKFEIKK